MIRTRKTGRELSTWTVVPTGKQVQAVARQCRRLVTKRALMAAGVAMVPIPGLDWVTDVGVLVKLLPEINEAFGLTPHVAVGSAADHQAARAWAQATGAFEQLQPRHSGQSQIRDEHVDVVAFPAYVHVKKGPSLDRSYYPYPIISRDGPEGSGYRLWPFPLRLRQHSVDGGHLLGLE